MTLEHELTTLPPNAIIILRYMAQLTDTAVDAAQIQNGAQLSDRAFSKAVKRLVTRNFMSMDEARFYHVTPKGSSAIEMLMAESSIVGTGEPEAEDTITYDMCAVIASELAPGQPTEWQIGVSAVAAELIERPVELYLRIGADGATTDPPEAMLSISPSQPQASSKLRITPIVGQAQVRIRVEAFQLFEMDQPGDAGGMYFDVAVGKPSAQVRAIHIPIKLA